MDRFRSALGALTGEGTGLLLGVSGGSDSMGLLHLAAGAREEMGLVLAVGFVNHGLRPEAKEEWRLVREVTADLGFEAHRLESVPPGEGTVRDSLQQWAREIRYRLLLGLARELGLGALATAHTLDDQAETVLQRMLRGAGVDGLGAIPRRRVANGTAIVRPLLGCAREEIRDWLRRRSVTWVEDPSNADPRFERTRVRGELLPRLDEWYPGVKERLASLADECRDLAGFADSTLERGGHIRPLRLGGGAAVRLDRVPSGVRSRMVRALLRCVRGDLRGIGRVHVEALVDLALRRGTTDAVPLPGGAVAFCHGDEILAFPQNLPPSPSGSGLPSASGPGTWRLRFAALGALAEVSSSDVDDVADLELRARRFGDRLYRSERKLKDVFIEAMVPRPYRDFVPVLAGGEGVVACPGILSCRHPDISVRWLLDENAPFLDVDFPMITK